ncbi:MAG: MASE1 domain-containing protein [Gemmatimonadota bacterium]|nr:MASE1 domain-containing protein [Gemmatimonadota bacterium]
MAPMAASPRLPWTRAAVVLAVALVVGYLASSVGYELRLSAAGTVFLWPPAGIFLAALILLPRRDWPALLAGSLLGNAVADSQHGATPWLAVTGSAVNALEQGVAAWVVTRFGGERMRLRTLRELSVFVFGAVVLANAATALLGALVLRSYGAGPTPLIGWWRWWAGDGMGMLAIVPVALTAAWAVRASTARQLAVDALYVLLVAFGGFVLLGSDPLAASPVAHHAYIAIPLVVLSGARRGPFGAALAALALTGVAAWLAVNGALGVGRHGPGGAVVLFDVYTFLALATVSALIPATVIAERERAMRRVRESEERFREIADHIGEAFFVAELPSWRPLYLNPAWERISGVALEVGRDSRRWLDYIHPDDRAAFLAMGERVQRGEAASGEFRLARPDGAERRLRAATFPVRDAGGRLVRAVGVGADVTDLRAAELQSSQLQKLEAVGRLAGGVAHDFNNLLTVIIAESEFLAGELPPDERAESVGEVRRAAERAAALTKRLLAFSRREIVEPTVFDVRGVVDDTSRMLARLLGERVTVEARTSGRPLCVRADRGQLEHVLTNLAVNARDAMPGGGRFTVEATHVAAIAEAADAVGGATDAPDPPDGWVQIAVSDTGHGMSREVLARAMEPFFTTKEQGQGTGLGLAMCHGMVAQAGGRIAITSTVGAGTTVRVYLPGVPLPEGGPHELTPRGDEPSWGTEVVLLVEDEPGVRKVAARILEMRGYEVIEAAGVAEAERVFETVGHRVQLLLTDVVLPDGNGRELAERLRARRPGLPTLFASGYTEDVLLRDRISSHDVEFIAKPFRADELARRVRETLDRGEARG